MHHQITLNVAWKGGSLNILSANSEVIQTKRSNEQLCLKRCILRSMRQAASEAGDAKAEKLLSALKRVYMVISVIS